MCSMIYVILRQYIRRGVLKSKGFSLLETITVMGVMSIITMGSLTLVTNTNKNLRRLEIQNEMISIQQEVATLMSNPAACLNNIGGAGVVDITSLNTFTRTRLKNSVNADVYVADTALGVNGLNIDGYRLLDDPSDPDGIWLFIDFNSTMKGGVLKNRKVKLKVTKVGNLIQTCGSTNAGAGSPWGQTGTDLYYI